MQVIVDRRNTIIRTVFLPKDNFISPLTSFIKFELQQENINIKL